MSLADAEIDRLSEVLARCQGQGAMNLEQLDGFCAALICGPARADARDYVFEIVGDLCADVTLPEFVLREFAALIARHAKAISDTLRAGAVFTPLLLEDDQGLVHGNEWANGFVRGMQLHPESWSELLDDEDHAGSLVAIFALAHEHSPDPELRPYQEPMSIERRENLIVGAAAGVMNIYRYFEDRPWPAAEPLATTTFRRQAPKIGRNEPCPCGSGKKFKLCCAKISSWH